MVWGQPSDIEALHDKPTTEGFKTSIDESDEPLQQEELTTEAFKDIRLGNDQSSATYDQAAQRFTSAEKPQEQEKPKPRSRYTVTKRSPNVIQLILLSGRQDWGTVECLEFVSVL